MKTLKNSILESSRTKMHENDVELLKSAMTQGFVNLPGDMNQYGICRENILNLFDENIYPKEVVQATIEDLEKGGCEFKYETIKDVLKDSRKAKVEF